MNERYKRLRAGENLFALLLLFPLAAFGQTAAIDPGSFDKDTYTNRSLGFTVKLAPGLTLDKEAMAEAPHSQQTSVLISAWTDIPPGSLRPGMVLYADRLSQFPEDRRTAEAYVARVVRSQVPNGYEVIHERAEKKVGENTLHCADFRKTLAYETVCVATLRGFALVFVFLGSGQEQVDTMMRSTGLELTRE